MYTATSWAHPSVNCGMLPSYLSQTISKPWECNHLARHFRHQRVELRLRVLVQIACLQGCCYIEYLQRYRSLSVTSYYSSSSTSPELLSPPRRLCNSVRHWSQVTPDYPRQAPHYYTKGITQLGSLLIVCDDRGHHDAATLRLSTQTRATSLTAANL
jgi:hypothetical protein